MPDSGSASNRLTEGRLPTGKHCSAARGGFLSRRRLQPLGWRRQETRNLHQRYRFPARNQYFFGMPRSASPSGNVRIDYRIVRERVPVKIILTSY
jgi:hypothetical protein